MPERTIGDCEECGGISDVTDSRRVRPRNGRPYRRRRHTCQECGAQWTTTERRIGPVQRPIPLGGMAVGGMDEKCLS